MKIRNDFVSNSSACSFILQLDKPIEEYDREEFHELFVDTDERVVDEIYETAKNTCGKWSYHIFDGMTLNQSIGDKDDHLIIRIE